MVHRPGHCPLHCSLAAIAAAAALCSGCTREPVACDLTFPGGGVAPDETVFHINGRERCKSLIDEPLKSSQPDAHPTTYVILGNIQQRFKDGSWNGILLFDPLGKYKDRNGYRETDLSKLRDYLDAHYQLIIGQLNGGTTKSAASGPRPVVPADMKSSKIIWQADENGDWLEFDFDNASDCKALLGPIFSEGTVVEEDEAMRVLAKIVVVYKGEARRRPLNCWPLLAL